MMKIKCVFIAIFVIGAAGCQTRYQSPKERSYLTAIQILRTPNEQDMIYKIKSCDDVDAQESSHLRPVLPLGHWRLVSM